MYISPGGLCCTDNREWCNGCTTCTDGKQTKNMKLFKRHVCKKCGAKMARFKQNIEVENEFIILFECGREVYNNPHPDPWEKEELSKCLNKDK